MCQGPTFFKYLKFSSFVEVEELIETQVPVVDIASLHMGDPIGKKKKTPCPEK